MPLIQLHGLASKTSRDLEVRSEDMDQNLLKWLRKKGVMIASSCDGEGVCRKCIIQNDLMTCQFSVRSFLQQVPSGKIEVSYL